MRISDWSSDVCSSDLFQQLIANNTVDDQLVAVPWFVDAGLLYYRRDLLEKHGKTVPKTWRDLTETTRAIVAAEQAAGDGDLQGFVWQGRAYEGLTCNALEWRSEETPSALQSIMRHSTA